MKTLFLFLTIIIVFSVSTEAQDLKGYFEKDSFEVNYVLEERVPKTTYSLELSICDLKSQIVCIYLGDVFPKDPNSYSLKGSFFKMEWTGKILTIPEKFQRTFISPENLNKLNLEDYALEFAKDWRFMEKLSETWKDYKVKPPKEPKVYDKN